MKLIKNFVKISGFLLRLIKVDNTSEYFGSSRPILFTRDVSFGFMKYKHNKINFISAVCSLKSKASVVLFNKVIILFIYFLLVILYINFNSLSLNETAGGSLPIIVLLFPFINGYILLIIN